MRLALAGTRFRLAEDKGGAALALLADAMPGETADAGGAAAVNRGLLCPEGLLLEPLSLAMGVLDALAARAVGDAVLGRPGGMRVLPGGGAAVALARLLADGTPLAFGEPPDGCDAIVRRSGADHSRRLRRGGALVVSPLFCDLAEPLPQQALWEREAAATFAGRVPYTAAAAWLAPRLGSLSHLLVEDAPGVWRLVGTHK